MTEALLLSHDPKVERVECHNCHALSWTSLCDKCGPSSHCDYGECDLCGKTGPIYGYACSDCEDEYPHCDTCEGPCRGRHVFYDERYGCPAGAGRLEGEDYRGPDFELIDAVIELLHLFEGNVFTGRWPNAKIGWAALNMHKARPPEVLGGFLRRDLWVQYAGSMLGGGDLHIRTPEAGIYAATMRESAFLKLYGWDDALMRDAGSWLLSLWPGGDELPATTEAYDVLIKRWAQTRDCSLSGCLRGEEA